MKLADFFSDSKILCSRCQHLLKGQRHRFYVNNILVTSLYPYDDFMQKLIIQYKESGDVALKDVFLEGHRAWFNKRYHRYLGILIPSHIDRVLQRGWSHLPLIYENTIDVFSNIEKVNAQRQMTQSPTQRSAIQFRMLQTIPKGYKKLVILDDVVTTGASIMAIANLLDSSQYSIEAFSLMYHRKWLDHTT